jgi:hypothetical protein
MPTIMCTRQLWRCLAPPSPLRPREEHDRTDTQLVAGSAKSIGLREGDLVVAITLNDLCIHVDAALEAEGRADSDALLRVQVRPSEIPHINRESVFPREAAEVLSLQAVRTVSRALQHTR